MAETRQIEKTSELGIKFYEYTKNFSCAVFAARLLQAEVVPAGRLKPLVV